MESQVSPTATGCRTQLTLVHRLVPGVDCSVSLQAVTLSEPVVELECCNPLVTSPGVTDITLIWFLPCVDPQMSLQFECVRTGVGAVGALVGSLATE